MSPVTLAIRAVVNSELALLGGWQIAAVRWR